MESIDSVTFGVVWYVVFVFSTTVHEAAHALAALKLGDRTAYHGGQVTLDPVPHMRREPVGMIVIPILSYAMGGWMMGWASCPYDPAWAHRYPRRAAWMALAGPASNLLLVIVAAIIIRIGVAAGKFNPPPPGALSFAVITEATSNGIFRAIATIVGLIFSLNLLLFAFNLIPLMPFDGAALTEFVLSPDLLARYKTAMANPTVRIVGFIIVFYGFGYIYWPLLRFAVNLLYPEARY